MIFVLVLLSGWILGVSGQRPKLLLDPKHNIVSNKTVFEDVFVPVHLEEVFNNRGFATKVGTADFDGLGSFFPAEQLPAPRFKYADVYYNLSSLHIPGNDNVIPNGQVVQVPKANYTALHLIAASHSGITEATIRANFNDGTFQDIPLLVQPWWKWPYPPGGDIIFPGYTKGTYFNYNQTSLFQSSHWIDQRRQLVSLTLMKQPKGRSHYFAISLSPATSILGDRFALKVESARATETWPEGLNARTRIVQVVVSNIGKHAITRTQKARVIIKADGLGMIKGHGYINRLLPGHEVVLDIGVLVPNQNETQKNIMAEVIFTGENVAGAEYVFNMNKLLSDYTSDISSVYSHETPGWFNDAKFGIFIHWGVYSVPAWGNSGPNESYAEWYMWNMQQPTTKDRTMNYHSRTYGKMATYDDFIPRFTAEKFNPGEWVNLFAAAGAKYFVITAKHHDGYALFDLPPSVSKRTSVVLAPKRNLVKELFDAAEKNQPKMRRGVYYSIPEWFHPDYKKYGFGNWPGGNASNPYTKARIPYTGYVPVKDYMSDLVMPSMRTLVKMNPDIMWCDIGGTNVTLDFASEWFNSAKAQERQVTMNNRCGVPGDFDTPEYKTYKTSQKRKWETNLGMDPHSYGLNKATPDNKYTNAKAIVKQLVDVVSKNGNLLLNIGPQADGTILEVMKLQLTNVGQWLNEHGEAIYGTKPWFVAAGEGETLRFTTSVDAFYIHSLEKPPRDLRIKAPVPWISSDVVTVVGGKMNGTVLPVVRNGDELVIIVPDEVQNADRYTWSFKLAY